MDRFEFCVWLRQKWPEIQREAIVRSTAAIAELEAEDVVNRVRKNGSFFFVMKHMNLDTYDKLEWQAKQGTLELWELYDQTHAGSDEFQSMREMWKAKRENSVPQE